MRVLPTILMVALLALSVVLVITPASATPAPGPDTHALKYRVVDNNGVGTTNSGPPPAYNYVPLGGTAFIQADNAHSACIDFGDSPNFAFNFYGTEYNCGYIASDGYLTFDSSLPNPMPVNALPGGGGPANLIAAFWTDHDPSFCSGTTPIHYDVTGTSPNRVFRVEWRGMAVWSQPKPPGAKTCVNGAQGPPTPFNTFELKLFEADDSIEVHLASATYNSDPGNTVPKYAIGTQATGKGIDYAFQTGAPFTSRVVRFYPNGAPVVNTIAPATLAEGAATSYTLAATDPNSDTIRGFCIEVPASPLGVLTGLIPLCSSNTLSAMPPPTLTYQAPTGKCGTDSFDVRAQDTVLDGTNAGLLGPPTTATITVTCNPDAPTLDPISDQEVDEDTPLAVTLTGITPGLGDVETLTVTATSADGTMLPNPTVTYTNGQTTGTLNLQGALNKNGGPVVVTVKVTEDPAPNKFVQRTFKVTLKPTPDAPIASDAVRSGLTPVTIDPPVTDPDGTPSTFTLETVSSPSHGIVSGSGPFQFKADRFWCGTDTFRYRASDGALWSAPATVTVQVQCPDNFPPSAQSQSVPVAYETAAQVTLQGVDDGPGPLTYLVSVPPKSGGLTGTGQVLTYTPEEAFCGEDTFEFRVSDGEYVSVDPGVVTLVVQCPADRPPVALGYKISAKSGDTVPVVLSGYDPDDPSAPVTFQVHQSPGRGVLTGAPPQLTYTPGGSFVGTDTLQYRAYSGNPAQQSAIRTITLVYESDAAPPSPPASAPPKSGAIYDTDGDGAPDGTDNCVRISNEDQADNDFDGTGNECDGTPAGDGDVPGEPPESTVPPEPVVIPPPDADSDGVSDLSDNCPSVANRGQADTDADKFGDACDEDLDGDGLPDAQDLCPGNPLPTEDFDADLLGDACDADADNDGALDRAPDGGLLDNCQRLANPGQQDKDRDMVGDACDADADGDGVPGVCPRGGCAQRNPAGLDTTARAGSETLGFVGAGFLVVVALVVAALPFFARAKTPDKPKK